MSESRAVEAVLFDLDDTLYPEREFAISGYLAVAAEIQARFGVPERQVWRILRHAFLAGRRATAFQLACEAFELPAAIIPGLVDTYRRHGPRVRLPAESRRVLSETRARWRTGIVTNGLPDVQRRKVAALGLEALVDVVVFAAEHGGCGGKPDAAPFRAALDRLGVRPERSVFVGDDPVCDIGGASAIGMRTVQVRGAAEETTGNAADRTVGGIAQVPAALGALAGEA